MATADDTQTYKRLCKLSEEQAPKVKYNLKIAIIVPPSPFIVPNGWEFVHSAPFEGPSIIAALLKKLGFKPILLDQRRDFNPESLAGGPLKSIDIVAAVTYSDSFPYLKRAVEIAKEEDCSRPVILGGPLISSAPLLIMRNTAADYGVIGEGELTLIELMDLLTNNKNALSAKKINGLAWKDENGRVRINNKRPQMRNIDAVPMQDFSVWPEIEKTLQAPEIYMTSSRGCPGNCSFCFRAMPALRHKSIERVRRELLYLKKYNYRFVWWSDLTFVDSRERVDKLLREAFHGIEFRWSCFTRARGLDLPLLQLMKNEGCDIVMCGFESLSEKILEYFKKNVSTDNIVNAISLTRQAGLKIGGLFIIGAPAETKESLHKLIEFCRRFKEITRVKYMSALPGTIFYYDALKQGIIKDELAHLYFMARERSAEEDEIINFTELPGKELRKAYRKINRQIEKRPYEYWNPENRYLPKARSFQKRGQIGDKSAD